MSESAFGLSVNGKKYSVMVEAETPLLFVLRDEIGLTGSKYGMWRGGSAWGLHRAGGAEWRGVRA